MANEKISAMPNASVPFDGGEFIPFVQQDVNVQASSANFSYAVLNPGANGVQTIGGFNFIDIFTGNSTVLETSGAGWIWQDTTGGDQGYFLLSSGGAYASSGDLSTSLAMTNSGNWSFGGSGFQLVSDGSGNINFDCSGLSMQSNPGFTGTVTPVTSITILNGIVTAVS
jgi:hypothetical protein